MADTEAEDTRPHGCCGIFRGHKRPSDCHIHRGEMSSSPMITNTNNLDDRSAAAGPLTNRITTILQKSAMRSDGAQTASERAALATAYNMVDPDNSTVRKAPSTEPSGKPHVPKTGSIPTLDTLSLIQPAATGVQSPCAHPQGRTPAHTAAALSSITPGNKERAGLSCASPLLQEQGVRSADSISLLDVQLQAPHLPAPAAGHPSLHPSPHPYDDLSKESLTLLAPALGSNAPSGASDSEQMGLCTDSDLHAIIMAPPPTQLDTHQQQAAVSSSTASLVEWLCVHHHQQSHQTHEPAAVPSKASGCPQAPAAMPIPHLIQAAHPAPAAAHTHIPTPPRATAPSDRHLHQIPHPVLSHQVIAPTGSATSSYKPHDHTTQAASAAVLGRTEGASATLSPTRIPHNSLMTMPNTLAPTAMRQSVSRIPSLHCDFVPPFEHVSCKGSCAESAVPSSPLLHTTAVPGTKASRIPAPPPHHSTTPRRSAE